MGSINKCIFSGRICSEVETRRTSDGTAVTDYRLAIDRRYKREGTPTADFINIVTWGNNAEFASKYFRKGLRVELVCRVQTRDYTNSEGKKIYVTEFVADEQGFGEPRAESGDNAPKYATPYVPAPTDEDIPPVMPTFGGFEDMSSNDDLPF